MKLEIILVFTLIVFASAAENGSFCITPNGENATCVPINDCKVIKDALAYLEEDATEFARNSQCGYDNQPLVCCGSVGRVTTPRSTPQSTTRAPLTDVYKGVPAASPIESVFLPDNTLCGLQLHQRHSRRSATGEHEFPWMVSLKYVKEHTNEPTNIQCSGTLINQKYVLTAAQCANVTGLKPTSALLGLWKFSTERQCTRNTEIVQDCTENVEEVRIVEVIIHPYYRMKSGNNDIALLRLEKKIHYNDYIRPVCLPPGDFPPPLESAKLGVAGWGLTSNGSRSDIKLKVPVQVVTHEECEAVFPNHTKWYPNRECIKPTRRFCNGESGAPLLRTYEKTDETEEEQWFQEGVIYKGFGCHRNNSSNLYLRVSRYISWILGNLQQA